MHRSSHSRAALIIVAVAACGGHAPAPAPRPAAHARVPAFTAMTVAEHSGDRVVARDRAPSRGGEHADALAHVLRVGQLGFARCFRVAQHADPRLTAARVAVRLRIDARGAVADAVATGADPQLGACLARGLRRLRVPRALAPAVLEVPIVFAAPTAG